MKAWIINFFKKLVTPKIDTEFELGERRRVNFYEILNKALALSMEFGPNSNKPINSRLKKAYPALFRSEIRGYNKLCYEITDFARDYMYEDISKMKSKEDFELMKNKFANKIRLYNNWINDENIDGLFNQSCYFAGQ